MWRASSSPTIPMVGFELSPLRYALLPVMAISFSYFQPMASYFSSVSSAVLNSLKPSSGYFQMAVAYSMISSAL